MIKIFLLSICFVFSCFAQDNDFHLKITNIKKAKGNIKIAFYDSDKDFPDDKAIKFGKVYKVAKTGEVDLQWKDIAFGTYAIAIYQDINENDKIGLNLIGYPNEPFAFSNNIKPIFAAPTYKECKILYSKSNNFFKIKLLD